MFDGFASRRVKAGALEFFLRIGGQGPPVVLLHGYPQTHLIWHRIAPALAQSFTVVCPDLRGYGASDKPPGDSAHLTYAKRTMAADQVAIMQALGFDRFAVVGHDRGGRVAHRLCLDRPEAVTRAAVIDIAPTRDMYNQADRAFATAYFHWFFLIQPAPLPERLLAGDPDAWVANCLGAWGSQAVDPKTLAAYQAAFRDPACIHATCEDYRAAASIDLQHDHADLHRRIECPLLVLWGRDSVVGRRYDPLALWAQRAQQLSGAAIDGGHFLPEESPGAVLAALRDFLAPLCESSPGAVHS